MNEKIEVAADTLKGKTSDQNRAIRSEFAEASNINNETQLAVTIGSGASFEEAERALTSTDDTLESDNFGFDDDTKFSSGASLAVSLDETMQSSTTLSETFSIASASNHGNFQNIENSPDYEQSPANIARVEIGFG